jgi:hypothetical protein
VGDDRILTCWCRFGPFLFVVRVKRRKAPFGARRKSMKYLLTFYGDESAMENASPEEMKEGMERWGAFEREAVEAGVMIACEPLETSSSATTIHLDEEREQTITDGPFTESKEQLGGFCLLEVEDGEEALEWANKVPLRPGASMEVRAVKDLSQFGRESATVSPAKAKTTA